MKALHLRTICSFAQVFLLRIVVESRPVPGGFTSSEALDAIGNRCNHLNNAGPNMSSGETSRVKDFDRVSPTVILRPKGIVIL